MPVAKKGSSQLSKKTAGWIALIAAIVGVVGVAFFITRDTRPRFVAIGHSYVARDGWVDQAADGMDRQVDKYAKGGARSETIAELAQDYDPKADDVVVIEAGLNDVRRGGSSREALAGYRQSLGKILQHVTAGTRPSRIAVLADAPIRDWKKYSPDNQGSDAALAAASRVAQQVAAKYRVTFVRHTAGWDPATMIGPDGIHPNKAGDAQIASAVRAAVSR